MAKSAQKRKVKGKAKTKPGGPPRAGKAKGAMGLDAAGAAYARLLNDPCNAPLASPVYSGTGSGYLVRLRTFHIPGGTAAANDSIFTFVPAGNAYNTAAASIVAQSYSVTSNGSLGTLSAEAYNTFLLSSSVSCYRPVAGCLKVHYTGVENNRGGMIHFAMLPARQFVAGELLGTLATVKPLATYSVRVGSEKHEFRWAPGADGDRLWSSGQDPSSSGITTQAGQSQMVVMLEGCSSASLSIEADFVYEWTPLNTMGVSEANVASRSRNSLNDVLMAITNGTGNIARWAISPAGRDFIGRAYRTIANYGSLAAIAM